MTSILTNNSAMTALKVLRQTESALGITQERISTGLKVNSAKDDASTWAISQGIKSDVAAFKTMGEGLTMAGSAIKVAANAAESINGEITKIKQNIAKAKQPGSDRVAIQSDIDKSLENIASITSNASFNGTNLVNNTNTLKVLASTSRDASGAAQANYIDVQGVNLGIKNGGGLSSLDGLKVTRDAVVTGGSTPQSVIDLGAATTPSTAAGTLTFNYETSTGQSKSVSLNVANGATAGSVAQNFIDTYGDALEADGLNVTTDGTGKLTVTSEKAGARLVSANNSATGLTDTQTNQVALNFNDVTLNDGDEFRISVNIKGKTQTAVFRVGSANLALGTDADGNSLISLNKANMTTADGIASELTTGMLKATWDEDGDGTADDSLFKATATNDSNFGVASTAGGGLTISSATDSGDFLTDISLPDADFADLLDKVETAAKVATSAAQAFGTAQAQAESQKDFLKNLVDSLETGVGALIDADITAESARLNALQTQQQLATQSLSIANQGSQLVLSLFR